MLGRPVDVAPSSCLGEAVETTCLSVLILGISPITAWKKDL